MITNYADRADQLVWNCETLPDDNVPVLVLATDGRGEYAIPFPCQFDGEDWINSHTGEHLVCELIGWRPLPVRSEQKAQSRD